ncbi:MAG: DUF3810 domain-containing protein [Clostridia bacterium]|nr:DUF3810 domain-containing protein [Clostridia bacterium]
MKAYRKLPRPLQIFFAVSLLILFLLPWFRLFPAFSDWFARYPAAIFRLVLGGISSLFPISLFEWMIALFCLYLLFLLFLIPITLLRKKKGKKALRLTAFLLAVPVVLITVLDLFVLTFASSYYRPSPLGKLAPNVADTDAEDVFSTLDTLVALVNETAPLIEKNEDGCSAALPFREVNERVKQACDEFADRNGFFQAKGYKAKTFLCSPWMTYTHISGIFGFFTGEANVNTNYPHFIVTASLAHESCHARGIAPENECNFLAAVILMESENAYLRYCGASFVLDDFISVARKLDGERTNELISDLDPVFARDLKAYSEFFAPYRDSTASKVADATNSAYLKSMGQKDGTVSYSRIIRLTCAYFREKTT